MDSILFRGSKGPHGFLSCFYTSPFELDGKTWKGAEWYFQAMKFAQTDPEYAERIRQAKSSVIAKRMGGSRKRPLREDWERVKEPFMLAALRRKFQIPALRKRLLATGRKHLVEDAPWDSYWGIGKDKKGMNRLGWLLVQVRQEILNPELADR